MAVQIATVTVNSPTAVSVMIAAVTATTAPRRHVTWVRTATEWACTGTTVTRPAT